MKRLLITVLLLTVTGLAFFTVTGIRAEEKSCKEKKLSKIDKSMDDVIYRDLKEQAIR